jgi:histidine triad (HIT) family protein
MSDKTLFQKIADREIPADIVYEDEHCVAFRDITPQAPTHILITPRKPIPRVGDATTEDQATLGALLLAAGKIADQLGINDRSKGFRLVINHGADGGETVPHLHVHLLGGRHLAWPPG